MKLGLGLITPLSFEIRFRSGLDYPSSKLFPDPNYRQKKMLSFESLYQLVNRFIIGLAVAILFKVFDDLERFIIKPK